MVGVQNRRMCTVAPLQRTKKNHYRRQTPTEEKPKRLLGKKHRAESVDSNESVIILEGNKVSNDNPLEKEELRFDSTPAPSARFRAGESILSKEADISGICLPSITCQPVNWVDINDSLHIAGYTPPPRPMRVANVRVSARP